MDLYNDREHETQRIADTRPYPTRRKPDVRLNALNPLSHLCFMPRCCVPYLIFFDYTTNNIFFNLKRKSS